MDNPDVRRRRFLKGGGAMLAGLSLQVTDPARALQRESDQERRHDEWDDDQPDPSQTPGQPGDVVLQWLDQPPPFPFPDAGGSQLVWEELDSWLIPPEKFHFVTHYGVPDGLDAAAAAWRVGVSGLVAKPLSLSLPELKARPRREVDFIAVWIIAGGLQRWSALRTPVARHRVGSKRKIASSVRSKQIHLANPPKLPRPSSKLARHHTAAP